MRRTFAITLALAVLLSVLAGPAAADRHAETADIWDQADSDGNRELLVEDGATLVRSPNSLQVRVALPTPQPGTYNYPTAGVFSGPGHPEGFTLWAFVFNFPDGCTPAPDDPDQTPLCDSDDVFDETPAEGGAFFVTGHLVGGRQLTLSGSLSRNSTAVVGSGLTNPAGAEVHLAVAPHGGLDEEQMPEQIKTPTGPPAVWWVALFL